MREDRDSDTDKDSNSDTYSIGWNFNGRFEGKGYASESANAFIENLFMEQGIRRLYAYVEDDNFRSQKLCEKLGMRREGLFWSSFHLSKMRTAHRNTRIRINMLC